MEPRPCLKALRPLLPQLKAAIGAGAKSDILIESFAEWLLGADGRIQGVGAAVPKMMVHLYDQAIIEEAHSKEWWATA